MLLSIGFSLLNTHGKLFLVFIYPPRKKKNNLKKINSLFGRGELFSIPGMYKRGQIKKNSDWLVDYLQ